MHATELRIGNYIWEKYGGIYLVRAISDKQTIKISKTKKTIAVVYDVKDIDGVPLTEEWLLKFGFIVIQKTVSLNIGGELMRYAFYEEIREDKRIFFVIYYSKRHGWTLNSVTSNKETVYFNSVHQLQNLFFTNVGEELTLKTE